MCKRLCSCYSVQTTCSQLLQTSYNLLFSIYSIWCHIKAPLWYGAHPSLGFMTCSLLLLLQNDTVLNIFCYHDYFATLLESSGYKPVGSEPIKHEYCFQDNNKRNIEGGQPISEYYNRAQPEYYSRIVWNWLN